jgi:hypothetical protein
MVGGGDYHHRSCHSGDIDRDFEIVLEIPSRADTVVETISSLVQNNVWVSLV